MKHGKRPTRAQKQILRRFGFDDGEWLVSKNTNQGLVIVHRHTDRQRVIPRSIIDERSAL